MDIDYGTRRTVVPLLVEDVAGSQTALKVEEIGAKVDKLESIIESTVPRGCYSHWRIVNTTTGEVVDYGMLDNSINNSGTASGNSSIISLEPTLVIPKITLILGTIPSSNNVVFLIPAVNPAQQKLELYNPYDTSVGVYEVTTTRKDLTTPIYLKHVPPYPSTLSLTRSFYYPNGKDVYQLNKAMGETTSTEDSNTVIGLLKSISNKL